MVTHFLVYAHMSISSGLITCICQGSACLIFLFFYEEKYTSYIALNWNYFRNYSTLWSTNWKGAVVVNMQVFFLLPLSIRTSMQLCAALFSSVICCKGPTGSNLGHTPPPLLVPMATASVPLQFTHILAWRLDESRHRVQPMPSEVSLNFSLCCFLWRERWRVTQDLEAAPGPNFPLTFPTTPLHWRRETRPRPAVILHSWRVCWSAPIASVSSLCWHFSLEKVDSCGDVSTTWKWTTASGHLRLWTKISFCCFLFIQLYFYKRSLSSLSIDWLWTMACFQLNEQQQYAGDVTKAFEFMLYFLFEQFLEKLH